MKSGYNIKEIRELYNLTQQELADALGLTRELVNKMEKGRSPVSKSTNLLLQKFLSARSGEEISHSGSELAILGVPHNLPAYHNQRRDQKNTSTRLMVPMVGLKAQAGYLKGFEQSDFMETLDHFPILPGVNPTGAIWSYFEVDGDSMEPTISSGDLLLASMLAHEDWNDIRDNGIYVILTDDQLMVKRVCRQNENEWLLCSDNKEVYPDITLDTSRLKQVWTSRRQISRL